MIEIIFVAARNSKCCIIDKRGDYAIILSRRQLFLPNTRTILTRRNDTMSEMLSQHRIKFHSTTIQSSTFILLISK